jgi:uncharacterized protein YciI
MKRTRAASLLLVALAAAGALVALRSQTKQEPEKQFLYRVQANRAEVRKNGPTPEEATILTAHVQYLKKLTREGVTILAARTLNEDETSFGIVIFRAASEDAAREVMNNDPAVKNGVMRASLFPFRVVLREGQSVPE